MKPIICIIEDDAAVRESQRLMLELHGYDVEEFEDGAQFLTRGRFDDALCIILDLNLPGENGLKILARLRAQAIATPAFIVTGRRMPASATKQSASKLWLCSKSRCRRASFSRRSGRSETCPQIGEARSAMRHLRGAADRSISRIPYAIFLILNDGGLDKVAARDR